MKNFKGIVTKIPSVVKYIFGVSNIPLHNNNIIVLRYI